MDTLRMTNYIIAVVFFVCYTYQFLYIPVPWLLAKRKAAKAAALEATPHNYAVLICARNESAVIADLIGSLRSQTYDQSLLHIFVLADNCTDDTSAIARSAGATVYERFNNVQVGKGYALQTLLGHLEQDYPAGFDGYFVFDADNILDPGYIAAMNRTFSQGHDIVTSYRNSKNYGDNWISAGYALWFLRESRYLNHARSLLGTSCAVSGTGFLFSRAVLEETGPWPFHLLTEDIQFSVHEILQGRKVAFAPTPSSTTSSPPPSASPGGSGCAGLRVICRCSVTTAPAFSGASSGAASPASICPWPSCPPSSSPPSVSSSTSRWVSSVLWPETTCWWPSSPWDRCC